MDRRWRIGLDIGGTKIGVVLAELADPPRLVERVIFPTAGGEPDIVLSRCERELREILYRHHVSPDQIDGIGIACGGPLDPEAGVVWAPPHLPLWQGTRVVERLRSTFAIEATLRNDADAGVLAEWRWGAARGTRHAVFITCGTGFGAGMILGGRLHTGAGGFGGEIGHVRGAQQGPACYGKPGSFDGLCGGAGLALRWQAISGDTLSAQQLAERARNGDSAVRALWSAVGSDMGRACALFGDLVSPEVIVLGSLYQRAADLLEPALHDSFRHEVLPGVAERCRIIAGGLGDDIGFLAALATVDDRSAVEACSS